MKRWIIWPLAIALTGCGAATRPYVGPVKADGAMAAPARHLALSYYLVDYHLMAATLAERGNAVIADVDNPDHTIDMANAKEYKQRMETRKRIYDEAIRKRGFVNIKGEYDTRVNSSCKKIFMSGGTSIIEQDEFKITFKNGPATHRGVIVENSLGIEHFALNPDVYLAGEVKGNQIKIEHPPSGCEMDLIKK